MSVLYVIVALAALFGAICLYCYFRCFYNSKSGKKSGMKTLAGEQYTRSRDKMRELMSEYEKRPAERIEIKSRDGLTLRASYYHSAKDAPLQILCHGYKGSAVRDLCGGSKLAAESGHSYIAIDQRANGESDGHSISFGIKEREDLLCWIEYANRRFGEDTPIILSGVSMGAATVLMASELPLPANVKAIVADCPYSSPYAIIRKVCLDMKLPPAPLMPFIRLVARLFGGFELLSCSAAEAVKHAKVPILIMHGEDDLFVPCEMSREIAANNPSIRLETFPGAGHGLSYLVDSERYSAILNDFLSKII